MIQPKSIIYHYNEDYVYKKIHKTQLFSYIWGASLFNYLEHSDIDAIGLHRYTDQRWYYL